MMDDYVKLRNELKINGIRNQVNDNAGENLIPLSEEVLLSVHGNFVFVLTDAILEQLKNGAIFVHVDEYNVAIGYKNDPA